MAKQQQSELSHWLETVQYGTATQRHNYSALERRMKLKLECERRAKDRAASPKRRERKKHVEKSVPEGQFRPEYIRFLKSLGIETP